MGETAGGDARRWDLRAGRFVRAVAGIGIPAGSHARTAATRMPS
jgi:hypothetical protein